MRIISVIIPFYNEEKTLETLLKKVDKLAFPSLKKEIVCVNDGSFDRSEDILKRLMRNIEIKYIKNNKNIGKSQSVRKGILASKGDIVVVQDADLETDPQDLVDMSELILEEDYDVAFGNRYDRKIGNKVSLANYSGNKFLTLFSNLFTFPRGLLISDMEVCYKMMKGNIARIIAKDLKSKTTIGIEPEITARIARYKRSGKRLKICNYPIKYFPRSQSEGKKVKYIKDGYKAMCEIVRFNLFE